MALVGEAHVVVRAITDKVRGDIQRGFQGSDRVAGNAGRNAGSEFQRGFRRGMGRGGRGVLFSKSFEAEAERARASLQTLIQVGNLLGPALASAAGAIGAAGAGLFSLGAAAAGAIPSIAVLPGLLLAAAQAAITLKLAFAGIGAAFSAGLRGSGGGGGGGGGGGIGRQALDNAKQIEAATERIADARRRLVEVLRENVERRQEAIDRAQRAQEDAVDAQKDAARADRDYADAQNDTRKAVEALAKAREEAIEDLQQLRFETEAANLGEKRARLEFEKSRDALQRVQDLPPNSRARQEAELAFAEADLNLRRAIDKNQDLQKEEKKATAAGVDGSDKVISAQENLIQAQRAQQDALEAKTRAWRNANRAQVEALKAQREIGNVERENAQRTKDAIKDLNDAYDDLNDARKKVFTPGAGGGGGGGGGLDPFAEAMSKLSKEAQDFVRFLLKIYPEFKKLQAAAGKLLFPKLEIAIQNLVDNLFPRLRPLLKETGGVIGDVAIKLSETITEGRNLQSLEKIWKTGDYLIRAFGDSVSDLVVVFLRVMEAAGPLIRRFADWVNSLTAAWRKTAEGEGFVKKLEGTFQRAGDTAAQLGRIFRDTFGGISQLAKAATGPGSGGQFLLDFFEKGAKKFKEFATLGNSDGSLKEYFLNASVNASKLLQLLGDIVGIFLKLGGKEGTGGFIDELRKAVPYIQQIADYLVDAGPLLGRLVSQSAELVAAFANSGALQAFYNILIKVAEILTGIVKNPIAQWFLGIAGSILGIASAIALITKLFGFFFKAIIGNIVRVVGFFGMLLPGALKKTDTQTKATTTSTKTLNMTIGTTGKTMQLTSIQTTAQATATRNLGTASIGAATGIKGVGNALKVAFISNPVGLAITALTTALGAFMMSQMNAKQAVDDLTASMDAQTGAATEATFKVINDALSADIEKKEEWDEITRLTGITQGEWAVAIARGGDELKNAEAALDAARQKQVALGQAGAQSADLLQKFGSSVANQKEVVHDANMTMDQQIAAQKSLDAALGNSSGTFDRSAGRVARYAREQRKAAEDAARLEGQIQGLEDAFSDLSDLLNADNSSINYRDSLRDLSSALEGNKKALFGNEDMYSKVSVAADKNRTVVNAAVQDMLDNVKDLGGSPKEVQQNFEKGVDEIRTSLKKAGFKKKDIDAYLKEFNLVGPESKKLLQKMIDAGEQAVTDMRNNGADAGQGYVNGLLSKKDEAYDAGYALGQAASQGTKDAQDSASPSKVFQKLGEDAVAGYAKGLEGFEEKAVKLFGKAIDKMVKDGDDKLKKWGEKAKTTFEKFMGDIRQLGEVMSSFKTDLEDALNPQGTNNRQALLEKNPLRWAELQIDKTGKELDKLSKKIQSGKGNTDQLIARFTDLAETLKANLIIALDQARANLETLRAEAANWRATVEQAIAGSFNISEAFAAAGEEGGASFQENLNAQAAKAREFTDKVKALIAAGFSQDTIQQVLAAGADAGSKIADELIAGGEDALAADQSIADATKELADSLYEAGYAKWYESGIKQAEENVAGIEQTIRDQFGENSKLNKVMKKLARRLGKDVTINLKLNKSQFTVIIDVVKNIIENFPGAEARAAEGGIVRRPTVTLVGEAGPEAIVPLGNTPGNSPLPGGLGSNIEINVYPSAGMDENELADMVSRKLAYQMRRGTI